MTRRSSIFTVLGIGLGWLVLDQWTKFLVVAHLTRLFPAGAGLGRRLALFYGTQDLRGLETAPAQVIAPVWEHLYVQNFAGAFGLLQGAPLGVRRLFFIGVAAVAAVGLLWMAARNAGKGRALVRVALGLVLGGALGNNLVDRVVHGYVIDFIHWHWKTLSWPPFNVADTGIVVGVIALLFLLGRKEEETARQQKAEAREKAAKAAGRAPAARRTGS